MAKYDELSERYMKHLEKDAEYYREKYEDLQVSIKSKQEAEDFEDRVRRSRPFPNVTQGSMTPTKRKRMLEMLHRKQAELLRNSIPTIITPEAPGAEV